MTELERLQQARREAWRQTPATRMSDADAAAQMIDQVGIATLFPASPEIPNLFHAFVGDANAKPEREWDSPAGHVYAWRWELGRAEAAFYTALVRKRPTWISWRLLPAVLRLRGELRAPEELYDAGELSERALRIAQVLDEGGGVLTTGELRERAGFPTGKPQRAAYLKAIEELDTRMLLAKVFGQDDLEMRHALVVTLYADQLAAAEKLTAAEAIGQFLTSYLASAVYALPGVLARHLALPEALLRAELERMAEAGAATRIDIRGQRGASYAKAASGSG